MSKNPIIALIFHRYELLNLNYNKALVKILICSHKLGKFISAGE
jgi:hypothetical protein